jgi:hypothetical protein
MAALNRPARPYDTNIALLILERIIVTLRRFGAIVLRNLEEQSREEGDAEIAKLREAKAGIDLSCLRVRPCSVCETLAVIRAMLSIRMEYYCGGAFQIPTVMDQKLMDIAT